MSADHISVWREILAQARIPSHHDYPLYHHRPQEISPELVSPLPLPGQAPHAEGRTDLRVSPLIAAAPSHGTTSGGPCGIRHADPSADTRRAGRERCWWCGGLFHFHVSPSLSRTGIRTSLSSSPLPVRSSSSRSLTYLSMPFLGVHPYGRPTSLPPPRWCGGSWPLPHPPASFSPTDL